MEAFEVSSKAMHARESDIEVPKDDFEVSVFANEFEEIQQESANNFDDGSPPIKKLRTNEFPHNFIEEDFGHPHFQNTNVQHALGQQDTNTSHRSEKDDDESDPLSAPDTLPRLDPLGSQSMQLPAISGLPVTSHFLPPPLHNSFLSAGNSHYGLAGAGLTSWTGVSGLYPNHTGTSIGPLAPSTASTQSRQQELVDSLISGSHSFDVGQVGIGVPSDGVGQLLSQEFKLDQSEVTFFEGGDVIEGVEMVSGPVQNASLHPSEPPGQVNLQPAAPSAPPPSTASIAPIPVPTGGKAIGKGLTIDGSSTAPVPPLGAPLATATPSRMLLPTGMPSFPFPPFAPAVGQFSLSFMPPYLEGPPPPSPMRYSGVGLPEPQSTLHTPSFLPVCPPPQPQLPIVVQPGITLSLRCDQDELSQYQILVRKQLEIFEATMNDIQANSQGRKKQIRLGQVGLRCRHCTSSPLRQRGKAAVYYPNRLQGVYQAGQNMAGIHLCEACDSIPEDLKNMLCALRESNKGGTNGGKRYWADACTAMGLYETDTGIRLRRR